MSEAAADAGDWVKQRGACRLDVAFEDVCRLVRRDVGEVNKLPANLRNGEFRVEEGEGSSPTLHVSREWSEDRGDRIAAPAVPRVSFTQEDKEIVVSRSKSLSSLKPERQFTAVVRWNNSGYCEIVVGDKPMRAWEVSHKALERFFFGDG